MQTVLISIHLMVVLALVVLVLFQRSEGGGLGMGGGSSGFMTGRGQANLLTRATAGLAAAFFMTSLLLSILANQNSGSKSLFDQYGPSSSPAAPAAPSEPSKPAGSNNQGGTLFDQLQQEKPVAPAQQAPVAPAKP